MCKYARSTLFLESAKGSLVYALRDIKIVSIIIADYYNPE